jgi:signal peptidase I
MIAPTIAVTIVITVVIAISTRLAARRRWVVVTIRGNSMAPTLRDGQRCLMRRIRRGGAAVGRNAIVMFAAPAALGDDALPLRVKRVAAVAGDPLPRWAVGAAWATGDGHVPAGKLVVVGDNPRSQGSQQLGYVDCRAVIAVLPS